MSVRESLMSVCNSMSFLNKFSFKITFSVQSVNDLACKCGFT